MEKWVSLFIRILMVMAICLVPCTAFSDSSENMQALSAEDDTVNFPDMEANADISIRTSVFGTERMTVLCFSANTEANISYRLFTKKYDAVGNTPVTEVSKPRPESEFDLFLTAYDQCDVMIAGYDDADRIILATPVAHVDLSRFARQPDTSQALSRAKRRSAQPYFVDTTQFPLIRIRGTAQNQARSSASGESLLPTITESGVSQDVIEYVETSADEATQILLMIDNSVSMQYQSPWFMPKLEKFLEEIAQSGMPYRIAMLPFGSPENTQAYLSSGLAFYEDAAQLLSVLETGLTFDSPHDDAVSALQLVRSEISWDNASRNIIVLAGNETVRTDEISSQNLVADMQEKNIRFFAFQPEQTEFSQLLTRRTGGGFYHFNNEDMTPILADINPDASEFLVSYQTDQMADQKKRQVDLSFEGDATARSGDSQTLSLTYTPPTPFDLMLVPRTKALAETSQSRRESISISVKVIKQDPAVSDPVVMLNYKDARETAYEAIEMLPQGDDIYMAEIPAEEMAVFGINYYITAALGDYQASLPSVSPDTQPFSFAVHPNLMPRYTFPDAPPAELIPGESYIIEAELYDETRKVSRASLYYRQTGTTEYAAITEELGFSRGWFRAEIPGEAVTDAGVDYYLTVTDDKGVILYVGDMDHPRRIHPMSEESSSGAAARRAARTVPTNGLIARYTLDGNANDTSGSGKNGTVHGGAKPTTDRLGNANSAYAFDGADDYIQVDQNVIPGSGDFTVTFWSTTAVTSPTMEAVSQDANSGGTNFFLGPYGGSFRCSDDWLTTDATYPSGAWHHFAAVKSSDDTRIYVDGSRVASKGNAIGNPTGSVFRIGRQYGPHSEYWNGSIDDVCVYNRALSGDEIASFITTATGETKFDGTDFTIYADSFSADSANNRTASGNIYIGRKYQDKSKCMLGYTNGSLWISSDGSTFKTQTNQGTLFAVSIGTRSNQNPHNANLFKGNFQRGSADGSNELSLDLEVTTDNQKILTLEEDIAVLKSRYTSASKIVVAHEKVTVTGGQIDFALSNPLLTFVDYGGVSSVNTLVWSRNYLETTSKQTFSLGVVKVGEFQLLGGSVTIDPINLGLEIHASGLDFGGGLLNFSSLKYPKLGDAADYFFLKGFTIGAQLYPPALTRFSLGLNIPSDLSTELTIGAPFGIAPKDVSLDLKNLAFHIPASFSISVGGAVYDKAQVLETIEKVIFTPLLSGQIGATIDLDGTIALNGNVKALFYEFGGFYGHVSRHTPQLKANGNITLETPLPFPLPNIAVTTKLALEGYYNQTSIGFGGSGDLSFSPPVFLVLIMQGLGICSDCNIAGVHASVSGSANTSGNLSLKLYSEAFFNYYYPACTAGWAAGFLGIPYCKGWGNATGRYKVWASVTLLPTLGGSLGGAYARSAISEPGVMREVYNLRLENGEEVPALVEFYYGNPVGVFTSADMRARSGEPQTVTLESDYDNATIIVRADAGIPQVEVTAPWGDEDGNLFVYDSVQHTGENPDDPVVFNSSDAEPLTVAAIKMALKGDYVIKVTNPDEVGEYTVEMSVPYLQPTFEIVSAQVVSQEEQKDIVEVTYNLDDPDTSKPYVTFRLDDAKGEDNSETALYLFTENADTSDFENAKIYGKGTEQTVRLVIDKTQLKSADYKLYGRAEDGITAPVVVWTDLDMTLKAPGVPEPPTNLRYTVSNSGVLLEWDPPESAENIDAYALWIENADNPDEAYEILVNPDLHGTSYEIVGLTNGQTYAISIESLNIETYDYSLPSESVTVTPEGLVSDGNPDLVVDAEETYVTLDDTDQEVRMYVAVKNVGTAASTHAVLEVYYGKMGPDFVVVDGDDANAVIDPLVPGATAYLEFHVPGELLASLTQDQEYAKIYPCIFNIINTEPSELNMDNNAGVVDHMEKADTVTRSITLKEGWNLISLPVDTFLSVNIDPEIPTNTFRNILGDVTIYFYHDGEWLSYGPHISESSKQFLDYVYSDEGFWVYSLEERTITLKDWPYQTDAYWLTEAVWNLMGTGEPIEDPLSYFQSEDDTIQAIWTYDNEQWVKNPDTIDTGEGFWVSRSASEQPPERPQTEGLSKVVLILRILCGSSSGSFQFDEIDVVADGVIDIKDAIAEIQDTAELR